MTWRGLKRYLPRGLFGRAALILIVPIVAIQLVVSVVFIQRHFNNVTEQMTSAVVAELSELVRMVNAAPSAEDARRQIAPLITALGLSVDLPARQSVHDAKRLDDLTGARVQRTLHAGLPELTGVDLARDPARVTLSLATAHGPLLVSFDRARVSVPNPHQLLVIMVLFSVLMTIIAMLFMRNQLRPIARLARAAEAFGKGEILPYRQAGATEVRAAGRAFLDMRARIERQIESRTMMLSGVSHDLRTPLTRMKLALSLMPEGTERDALARDVEEMERLVDGFLAFARAEARDDALEMCDPAELARAAAARAARGGAEVELGSLEAAGEARLRPLALGRALDNLLTNAARYGSRARLSLAVRGRTLRFVVEDDGPGIAPGDRAKAVRPFSRLDAARNQNGGSGVGLGLTIAAEVARAHGGALVLGESAKLGGLSAELQVPI